MLRVVHGPDARATASHSTLAAGFAHQHSQHCLQLRGGKWFGKKDDRPGRKTLGGEFWILLGGHHHHRDLIVPVFGPHKANQFRALNVRHDYIKHRRGEVCILLQRLVRLSPVARDDHCKTFLLQDCRHQAENGRVVIGDQDASF